MKKIAFYSLVILTLLAPLLLATPAQAACTGPAGTAGNVVYNTAGKVFQYCNNTAWVAMNKPGTGSGGCANPTLSEGGMVFNADGRVLQGCAGSTHRAFGPVGGGAEWVKISASTPYTSNQQISHACGILNNGTLWCWGVNGNGELGNGTTTSSAVPVAVPGSDFWIDVAAGSTHSCGIKSDGRLFCWGERYGGKIGNGGSASGNQLTPVEVTGGGVWVSVTAGEDSTCGIQANGKAFCWGERSYGRLGVGGATSGNQTTPVLVTGEGAWKKIDANATHTCGIKTDDTAWCWGYAQYGKTGRGNTTDAANPVLVFSGTDKWLDIDAGFNHTCGIKANGTAWCWGAGTGGQLGDGATTNRIMGVAVTGGGTWTSINAANTHSCGIKTGGTLFCWGTNTYGEIGDDTTITRTSPVSVAGGAAWKAVSGGSYFTCGIRMDGRRNCWGSNGIEGRLGDGATISRSVPTPIEPRSPWKYVTHGHSHICGIKTDDTLWCWGANEYGQLGNNTTSPSYVPVQVTGGGSWRSVSATGQYFTCGVKTDNTGWCWGRSGNGYLGNGTGVDSPVPYEIDSAMAWKIIETGNVHACGIQTNDRLYCWGSRSNGRIGNGGLTTGGTLVPIVIGTDTWQSISAGGSHTCGIKMDGTAWCWGAQQYGRLGNGSTSAGDQTTPLAISGGGTWKTLQVALGGHSCAIKSDDTLWCWGYNVEGQVGNGSVSATGVATPVQIGTDSWKSTALGNAHSCGIKTNDTLWCWGANGLGRLGNGTTAQQTSPIAVSGGGHWSRVAIGYEGSCAVTLSGNEIYCWGSNDSGELTNTEFSAMRRLSPLAYSLCQNPLGKPGQMVYDSTRNQLQYCDGAGWVSIGGPAPAAPPVPTPSPDVAGPTAGLLAYWRFDEGSGYIAADSSGNGNPGILSNMTDADWVAGRVGGALDFDGTNDYVWVGATPMLANVFPVTVCAWVYPRTTSSTYPIIMDKSGDGQDGWNFYLEGNRINYYNLQGDAQGPAGPVLPMNTWTHVCVTWDGTEVTGGNPTGGVKRYMNGAEYSPGEPAFSIAGALNDAAFSLTIGAAVDGTEEFFNGLLDELRIYNRVLSPAEITELYGL